MQYSDYFWTSLYSYTTCMYCTCLFLWAVCVTSSAWYLCFSICTGRNVSLHMTVDPCRPSSLPELKFLGPEHGTNNYGCVICLQWIMPSEGMHTYLLLLRCNIMVLRLAGSVHATHMLPICSHWLTAFMGNVRDMGCIVVRHLDFPFFRPSVVDPIRLKMLSRITQWYAHMQLLLNIGQQI